MAKRQQSFNLSGARRGAARVRRGGQQVTLTPTQVVIAVMFCLFLILNIGGYLILRGTGSSDQSDSLRGQAYPAPLTKSQQALALDLIKMLECSARKEKYDKKQQQEDEKFQQYQKDREKNRDMPRRRRLFGPGDDKQKQGLHDDKEEEEEQGKGLEWTDDLANLKDDFEGDWQFYEKVSAHDALCLAAGTPSDKLPDHVTREGALQCDVLGERRGALLDAWKTARQNLRMDVIEKTLDLAVEQEGEILEKTRMFWAPEFDEGFTYMVGQVGNVNHTIHKLHDALGRGKLFVDMGSSLGVTTLAVSWMYPGTSIISVEPASPSWLIQLLNLACLLDPDSDVSTPALTGVGPRDATVEMTWKPTDTRNTWKKPQEELQEDDISVVAKLRPFRSIMADTMPEDLAYSTPISVLNVDCEGCEYYLIPAIGSADYESIHTVMGEIHWGYIPEDKLPTSERASKTHERLCQHKGFAKESIECCAFPHNLVKGTKTTVRDISKTLCDGFDAWAKEKRLFNVFDESGWFELQGMKK